MSTTSKDVQQTNSNFLDKVTADGSSGFKAEKGRYHLYICYGCPYSHRAFLTRGIKGLEDVISMSPLDAKMGETGFCFGGEKETVDPLHGRKTLREVYLASNPNYQGSFSVPVLFDKKKNVIVSNQSVDILRMFNSEFNEFAGNPSLDLYPENLRSQIDEVNSWVAPFINNGVYGCGQAAKQEEYEDAFDKLFVHLDKAEELLSKHRYLTGSQFTEADVRLWTSLLRFDAVYYVLFKCNGKLIAQYENLLNFAREIFQMKGAAETVNWEHIKIFYYQGIRNLDSMNPRRIIAKGPLGQDNLWKQPHNRDKKFSKMLSSE